MDTITGRRERDWTNEEALAEAKFLNLILDLPVRDALDWATMRGHGRHAQWEQDAAAVTANLAAVTVYVSQWSSPRG